jgi:hypothetical protein
LKVGFRPRNSQRRQDNELLAVRLYPGALLSLPSFNSGFGTVSHGAARFSSSERLKLLTVSKTPSPVMTRSRQIISRIERAFRADATENATDLLENAIPIKLFVNVWPFNSRAYQGSDKSMPPYACNYGAPPNGPDLPENVICVCPNQTWTQSID